MPPYPGGWYFPIRARFCFQLQLSSGGNLPVEAYTAFEVWFEGIENCPEFEGYCGGGDVGAYVPKEVIQAFIDSRGGVVAT